jgi:hypothetical protein
LSKQLLYCCHFSGGAAPLQELKRDIHGFIASKANINIEVATSYGGETFLVFLLFKVQILMSDFIIMKNFRAMNR